MKVAWLVVLLAVCAASLPYAAAQLPVPTPTGCGPIDIPNDPATPVPLEVGSEASVNVEVVNPGQLAATVTITSALSNAAGWRIVSNPESASIPSGGTGTFTFVVSPGADAVASGTIAFSASGTCDAPGGLPCPGTSCNAGSANAQVQVQLTATNGLQLTDFFGIPIEYIVAFIVLIGLASAIPFAMRRKKGGVVADCPEPLKMVRAGRGTSFPIEIRNATKDAATAQFEVGPVPEGWSAFMPLPEVQLAAREARSLWLMVRSPASATVGDAVDVELRLRDPRTGGNGTLVKVRAEVQGGAEN